MTWLNCNNTSAVEEITLQGIWLFMPRLWLFFLKCYPKMSFKTIINKPGHEKMCLMSYANNKGADQPSHLRSLISTFIVRCLDIIISLDSIAKISRL